MNIKFETDEEARTRHAQELQNARIKREGYSGKGTSYEEAGRIIATVQRLEKGGVTARVKVNIGERNFFIPFIGRRIR